MIRLFTFQALDPTFNAADFLTDAGKAVFDGTRTGCGPDSIRAAAAAYHPTAENVLTREPTEAQAKAAPFQQFPLPLRFTHPLFIGTGLSDTTVLPSDQHHFATLACAAGSVVERHYYPGVDHSSTALAAQPDSIPFVRSVLAGRAVTNTCATLAPPPTQ